MNNNNNNNGNNENKRGNRLLCRDNKGDLVLLLQLPIEGRKPPPTPPTPTPPTPTPPTPPKKEKANTHTHTAHTTLLSTQKQSSSNTSHHQATHNAQKNETRASLNYRREPVSFCFVSLCRLFFSSFFPIDNLIFCQAYHAVDAKRVTHLHIFCIFLLIRNRYR